MASASTAAADSLSAIELLAGFRPDGAALSSNDVHHAIAIARQLQRARDSKRSAEHRQQARTRSPDPVAGR